MINLSKIQGIARSRGSNTVFRHLSLFFSFLYCGFILKPTLKKTADIPAAQDHGDKVREDFLTAFISLISEGLLQPEKLCLEGCAT